MKKTAQILIAIALFSLSSVSYGQETHTITLNVNTAEIANPNISQFCNFGQPSTITNENFTLEVNVGDIVVWKGVSSSSPGTDVVKITAINHVGGKNVFDKNVLKDTPQRAGIVLGKVLIGQSGEEQEYKLSFKVLNNGVKRKGTFNIDPKIHIK